ncbi:uncharacterized protein ccdc141 isoform X2 [Melanotaenia boesemani]|uniref:uncharacterized protein ccdc141 isoform X2 n=1 Tax=Melanotaenia boesemani TaxID=1250792 RepID=UPI001C0419E8|nr:uncharacterized protein ccdc141 isoform X2 [Melanotaenia boesemani]
MKLCQSFTTLSTIAVHAGQSQIIISVLKSGSLVHLQLVQVQPGLCEIGLNQAENQVLIQEQQQLLEKLQKHEAEVLSVVEKKEAELRRRDGRRMKQEEEEKLNDAMEASLREGWSLLLLLLKRRLDVLMLASDFYRRALEFSGNMDQFEDLQIEADEARLTEVQRTYDSMRRGVLGKSLQVLNSSSILLQKLRQLQKTEALQRRGGVLQEEAEEEEEEEVCSQSSWSSRGPALMLEQLVEKLQDRRRKVEQTVRLQLQQAESIITMLQKECRGGSDVWCLSDGNILDQNVPFGSTSADLHSETRTTDPGSSSDQQPEDQVQAVSDETEELQSEFREDEELNSELDLNSESRSHQTKHLKPGSGSYESRSLRSKDRQHNPHSDLNLESQSKGTRNFSLSSRSDLKLDSTPGKTRYLKTSSRSGETTKTRSKTKEVHIKSTSEMWARSRSEQTRDLKTGSHLDLQEYFGPKETKTSQLGFTSVLENESLSEVKLGSGSHLESGSRLEIIKDPRPGSGSDDARKLEWRPVKARNLQPGFRPVLKPISISDEKRDSRSEKTKVPQSGSRFKETQVQRSAVEDISLSKASNIRDKPNQDEPNHNICNQDKPNQDQPTRDKCNHNECNQDKPNRDQPTRDECNQNKPNRDQPTRDECNQNKPNWDQHTQDKPNQDEPKQDKPNWDEPNQDECNQDRPNQDQPTQDECNQDECNQDKPIRDQPTRDECNHNECNQDKPNRDEPKQDKPNWDEPNQDKCNQDRPNQDQPTRDERNQNKPNRDQPTRDECNHNECNQDKPIRDQPTRDECNHNECNQDKPNRDQPTRDECNQNKPNRDQPTRDECNQNKPNRDQHTQDKPNQDEPKQDKPSWDELILDERNQNPAAGTSGQVADLQSMLGNGMPHGEDSAHCILLTNQRQQLLMAFECLEKKVSIWMQESSTVLANSSEEVRQLSETEHTLDTHLQLHNQAQSAGCDVQNLKQILDQLQALQVPASRTSSSGSQPQSQPSRQPSTLKALTEQLRRGGPKTQTRTGTTQSRTLTAGPTGPPSPELSGRVDLVLKELQSLEMKIRSNLQTLQPFVIFLRAAQQVEKEMEDLRFMSKRGPRGEEEEDEEEATSKTRVDTCWQQTLQRVLDAEELGNICIQAVTMVLGSGLNLDLVLLVVQQTLQRLNKTKEEMKEMQAHHQNQDMKFWRRYQERLMKTHQDLNCVADLLDSCTLMDLGSDLQTFRLLDHFRQARPHFRRLDAEVENVAKTWEVLRGVQDQLEEEERGTVKEEDLMELLKLQKTMTEKIQQSESILDLSSSFHLTAKQLEVLLQSEPSSSSAGSTGSSGSTDTQQQIQNLLETASMLKSDVCAAVAQSGRTGFQVEQLEAWFGSLDSLCRSWLNEAARHEEKQRREQLIRLLLGDVGQLRDSFRDVKKRFSNTKFNYLKRNDRTRNVKAIRNQLQQVELYQEKLQALRKRVHDVTARLGSEVKDGGVARQVEDATNELQRQMGEFERGICEHQKTLDMTCKLQQAMEEYQFWCEEASATITRVRKFSIKCRSTEAVNVLYRQFEKFVWPTVPQQEERISQISELAVRLHGVEEGRHYTEKTVNKHSEMVASIRELSDGLIELEAKLKLESLKRQNDEEEKQREQRREKEMEEKENKMKEKKKEKDECSTGEAADMYELKETGHTPELTAEHHGKEAPVRRSGWEGLAEIRQSNSKRFTSSYSASFSISSSPMEANRQVNIIHSHSQPVVTKSQAKYPPLIGPSFSDIQEEFQKKEIQETLQEMVSTCCGLTTALSQDASAAAEIQQEVMMEDSLSNDEYDCVSPDDISLPPLAETPESNMFQSDVEESFCFSSHSIHISQYCHQCLTQSEQAGTGAVPQLVEPSQRDGCPTSSISLHSSSRFRTESTSLVQSPLTVPAPRLFTSTLCTILKNRKTITDNYQQSADLSLPPESRSMDGFFKDDYVPKKRSSSPITQVISDNVPTPQASDLSQSCCPEPARGTVLHKCSPHDHHCQTVIWDTSLTESLHDSESRLHQDMNPIQRSRQTTPQTEDLSRTSTSSVTQQNIYFQSFSESHCAVSQHSNISAEEKPSSLIRTQLQVEPVLKTKWFAARSNLPDPVLHKYITHPLETDQLQLFTTPQTNTKPPDELKISQSITGLISALNQDVPSSVSRKEAALAATSRGNSLTGTTPSTQQTAYCSSQPEKSFNQGTVDPPDGRTHGPLQINTINNIQFSNKQSLQTVRSLHESQTSTHVQQCVHGTGMSPSILTQPQTEAQTQALSQQANLHVTPPSSPPHLLTPHQDPDICLPMAIREEIRLTPQIQGPPLLPPHLTQTESLPQGKASRPGPPYFTRPLSQATVMEGSPVTLEVEVMGHPEPMLTWWKDGEVSASDPGQALPCE